jgi:hypothetical protein
MAPLRRRLSVAVDFPAKRPPHQAPSSTDDDHAALVRARRVFRYLPSPPRCKVCNNPFGGLAARGPRRTLQLRGHEKPIEAFVLAVGRAHDGPSTIT